ncbi:exodeoxyribonuclease III [Candidatus Aalborgicola defluviihabitans]|jgi:exodeoxyribonuclease-3|uniref:exodeoxyribonuclease III n=1 Tax=Candidatus Aalborgicola defluviihabitans TaxID=3386187 RepID=UPI001D39AB52|nr:exodeoxyribonuclease III [Burkholderiales bacterium]MBK6568323.1 exodeoxyribonuclease III [Burkholderiales bacterium]MBK7280400.1 exodeoxyribonuclease III [Burkholderiales bacterium]MBK7313460.1 exodeoxyribonuclease III [Burkholderiales bacterium]MBL0244400.1 exodeoxyribonuclease III [Rhodoferax sp.]
MKLATWNINSLSVRLPQVLDWLAANPVDVLALQELKMTDDKFPADAFQAAGYSSQWFGQKTYNGVALLTRTPATEVVKNIPGFDDDMARVITGTVEGVRVIGAYFPNGQAPGTDKFEYKMEWLKGLRHWVKAELERHPQLVLMGDYNITFDDLDVWDPEGMREQIHCTEDERYHLRALIALGLHDSYRLFDQPAKSYSWWDYRDFGFRRNRGMRIDHILISNALKDKATACTIDKTPRSNERPSDHTPVVLTLN